MHNKLTGLNFRVVYEHLEDLGRKFKCSLWSNFLSWPNAGGLATNMLNSNFDRDFSPMCTLDGHVYSH